MNSYLLGMQYSAVFGIAVICLLISISSLTLLFMRISSIPQTQGCTPGAVTCGCLCHNMAECLGKRWKGIICGVLIGLALALVTFFCWPQIHVSDAKILLPHTLESTPELMLTQDQPGVAVRFIEPTIESLVATEMELLTSYDLADRVAASLAPHDGGMTNEPSISGHSILKRLKITAADKSRVIRIAYSDSDPTRAQNTLNTLITNYLISHFATHHALGSFEQIIETKTYELQADVMRLESKMSTLKSNLGVVSFDEALKSFSQQASKVMQDISAVEMDIQDQTSDGATPVNASKNLQLQRRLRGLIEKQANLKMNAMELDNAATEYERLRNSRDFCHATLKKYSQFIEQARLEKNVGSEIVSNIRVVQSASPPQAQPKRGRIVTCVALVMLGAFLGSLWVCKKPEPQPAPEPPPPASS